MVTQFRRKNIQQVSNFKLDCKICFSIVENNKETRRNFLFKNIVITFEAALKKAQWGRNGIDRKDN